MRRRVGLLASLAMVLLTAAVGRAAEVTVAAPAGVAQIDYALTRFPDGARRVEADPAITVNLDAGRGPEAYAVSRGGNGLRISAGDGSGAMYALLDVAGQLRRGTLLDDVPAKEVKPGVAFRAIKFNLPFAAYRNGPSLEQHQDVCRDPKFWEALLDTMAENRFNALTLWSLHPFYLLTVPKDFPEAQTYTDAQMREWRDLFTAIFRMAKQRGIETYLVNWNTYVSPAFARSHGVATWSTDWGGNGEGAGDDPLVIDYTRQCVTQTIDEYPDLTGLGITLGERMGGQTPDGRRDWLDRTFFEGIRRASRPVKFIYRAPLSADTGSNGSTSAENDLATRKQIESLGDKVIKPVHVEFKFNWSHGHSSPDLFIVHGGELSDAYFKPTPTAYDVVWTVRNEDFYILRWGEPDFIRQFITNNTGDGRPYTRGVIVGSEVFIPAKDYISTEGRHRTWDYLFQRNWLFWSLWGRLLYEPSLDDAELAKPFADRFGLDAATAKELLSAWSLASKTPLRFASFHQGNNDLSLYTESFGRWRRTFEFFDIDKFIDHPVLDTSYVNIPDFVAAADEASFAGRVTPLALADRLDADLDDAMAHLAAVRSDGASPTLEAELTDIEAWDAFGRYFAEKLRGGVALERFRKTGDPARKAEAVSHLQAAVGHWKRLAGLGKLFNKPKVLFYVPWSWTDLIPEVEADVETARNATPSTRPS